MEFKHHLGSHRDHLLVDGVHMPVRNVEILHEHDLSVQTLGISGEAQRQIGPHWSLICFKSVLGEWRVGPRSPPHEQGFICLFLSMYLKCLIVECRTVTKKRKDRLDPFL